MADERLGLPAGLRFHPTDLELVAHLSEKLNGSGGGEGDQRGPSLDVLVPTVDLYGDTADPWRVCQQLAYPCGVGSTEFYCFTPRRQKYGGGSNADRTAGSGTWTANGRDKDIYDRGVLIGHKTHLTFKIPLPPGSNIAGQSTRKSEMVNTHWVMHEYRLHRPGFQKMVVCKVHYQKKEREEDNPLWSPPWWEQQEGGCSSGKKRKAAPSCEDAAVPTQKQSRRRGLGGREVRAIAAPSRVDPVIYMGDSTVKRHQPAISAAAADPAVGTSATASRQGPLCLATSSDDGKGETFSSVNGELGTELLLGSSQEEGMYYQLEAPLSIGARSGVLRPQFHHQGNGFLCSSVLPTDHHGYRSIITLPAATVLKEPLLCDEHLRDTLHIGDPGGVYYISSGTIMSPPEEVTSPEEAAGSIVTSCEDRQTGLLPRHDYYVCSYADGHMITSTSTGAGSGCSISNSELLHYYGDVTSDAAEQVCQSHLIRNWDQLIHEFSREEEEEEVESMMPCGYSPLRDGRAAETSLVTNPPEEVTSFDGGSITSGADVHQTGSPCGDRLCLGGDGCGAAADVPSSWNPTNTNLLNWYEDFCTSDAMEEKAYNCWPPLAPGPSQWDQLVSAEEEETELVPFEYSLWNY